jgi:hypothetical protein
VQGQDRGLHAFGQVENAAGDVARVAFEPHAAAAELRLRLADQALTLEEAEVAPSAIPAVAEVVGARFVLDLDAPGIADPLEAHAGGNACCGPGVARQALAER